jgi:hypothetical protein
MLPLALSLLPAAYQIGQGIYQKSQAKKLKESTFVPPELTMNRDLAQQQAFSRRAPGQGFAEEQIRRNTANTISAGQRSFGGDANKAAAVASAANAQANDATSRLAAQGQQFSENALGRLSGANMAIAGQKRQNRNEFNAAKSQLIAASNQNIFNGISNAASAGLTSYFAGGSGGGIPSDIKNQANTIIGNGRTQMKFGADEANRTAGRARIQEGRQMKQDARKSMRGPGGNGMWNSYLQMQNGQQQGFRFDPYTGQPIGN